MSEFVVLGIENVDNDFNSSRAAIRQKFRQVQVEIARKEDFGVNDRTFIVNTHLGEILNFNDTVLAYDLQQCNISDLEEHQHVDAYLPDIVIVKKTFPKFRKRQKNRIWKLKHFEDDKREPEQDDEEMQQDGDEEEQPNEVKAKKKSKKAMKRDARQEKDVRKGKDYEHFLQDLEDDPELRANVNLYKDDDIIGQLEAKIGKMTLEDSSLKQDLAKGSSNIGGQERKVSTGVRKTAIGKAKAFQEEKQRQQSDLLIKANLK